MLTGLFNQYHAHVKAVNCFLELLHVKVNPQTTDEALQNHPNWPSLLCVSDALHKWNISNAAGKVEPKDIDTLPVPFIAYTHNIEYPLAVVKSLSSSEVQYFSNTYKKAQQSEREAFIKNWTGIYLIAEPHEQSGEKNYEINRRKQWLNKLLPACLLLLLTASALYFFITRLNEGVGLQAAPFLFPIYFLGIIVTSLLLWYEIDRNNPLLQKVCTGIAKGNCNAILTGRQAKVFTWLSWSEVGFFWFTGGFLMLLFGQMPANLHFLGWVNLLALPYPVFSIYYQWRVAKQWCVLCLAVQVLLAAGAGLFLLQFSIRDVSFLSVPFLLTAVLLYALPVTTWYVLKPYVMQLQEAKNTKREYLRIKFNTEIFETLLKKQKQITLPVDGLGIEIGNPLAKHSIVKVCNPYCGPCSKAHAKIEELLEETENVKVKIIFTAPRDEENKMYKPVSHLLAIEEKYGNDNILKEALDRWYLSEEKEYKSFAAHYPMNGELQQQGEKVEAMYNWCIKMEIMATPTLFINGYQLPDAYDVKDLKYFLED
jgi:thiol-disulfide isomerase/thioredoxin